MLNDLKEMGVDKSLPEDLRKRLLAIPAEVSADPGYVPPMPQSPLPGDLRQRLLQIPAINRPHSEPPEWLLSPRYAAAASLLLATITMSAFGNPVARGQEAAGALTQVVQGTYSTFRDEGRSALAATADSFRGGYESTRQSVLTTADDLATRWSEISSTIRELTGHEQAPSGTETSSAPSAGEDKEKENGKERDSSRD